MGHTRMKRTDQSKKCGRQDSGDVRVEVEPEIFPSRKKKDPEVVS